MCYLLNLSIHTLFYCCTVQ